MIMDIMFVLGGNGVIVDEYVAKKISEGLKRHYSTHESKTKGRKNTEETKLKMSQASMGKPGTNKGKKFSEEWKKKISIANTNNPNNMGRIPTSRKLTMEQAKEIRKRNSEGESIGKLCLAFNVSRPTVSRIVRGLSYKEKINNE